MTRTNRVTVLLLVTTSLAVAGFAGINVPDNGSVAIRVAQLLDYDAAGCNTNCEMGGCKDATHNNASAVGGNDGGKEHNWCEPGGCSESGEHDHSCDRMAELVPPEALHELFELIPQIQTRQLLSMDREDPNLFVNRRRKAVQVLGCEGLVLASIDLTPPQAATLALLE